MREVQHSGYEDSLGAGQALERVVPRAIGNDRRTHAGSIAGSCSIVNPVVTQKATGAPAATGGRTIARVRSSAATLRWGITNNLTLTGTANPDFAEVESDAGQFVIDPRQALFFPEKRPFFLEGLEQFSVPHTLIYTRRIAQPDAAVKLTGKVAGTSVGFLSAADDRVALADGPRRDRTTTSCARSATSATQSRIGMAYTDRVVGGDYNRVADVDGRVVFGDVYYGARSSTRESYDKTRERGAERAAVGTQPRAQRQAVRLPLLDDGHRRRLPRAGSGFISRAGHRARRRSTIARRGSTERGSMLEALTGDILFDDTWQYSHFVRRGDAQDKKFHVSTSGGLRGGWNVGAGVYWETFGWDTQLYAQLSHRANGRPDGRHASVHRRRAHPEPRLRRSRSRRRSGRSSTRTLLYVGGQDENFFEWAQANIDYLTLDGELCGRATSVRVRRRRSATRITGGAATHSLAGRNVIPRVKVEYQLTRSIFVRVVGEYDLASTTICATRRERSIR